MDINSCVMEFDGEVLERGFWLYVWEILYGQEKYIYVGRYGRFFGRNAASDVDGIFPNVCDQSDLGRKDH